MHMACKHIQGITDGHVLKVCGSITGIFGDAIPEEVTGLSWSKIGASGEGSGEK